MFLLLAMAAQADSTSNVDCTCFAGLVHSSDEGHALVRLCRAGDTVTGTLDWVGMNSGSNSRKLSGTITATGFRLHDEAITSQAPSPGWKFCKNDRYDLRWLPSGGLGGTYASLECLDSAQVDLEPTPCSASPPAKVAGH